VKEPRLAVVRPPEFLEVGVGAYAEHVVVRGHAPVVAEWAGGFGRHAVEEGSRNGSAEAADGELADFGDAVEVPVDVNNAELVAVWSSF
jgi:hypothetical protein